MAMQQFLPRPFFNLDLCTENLGCETGVNYLPWSEFHADHHVQMENRRSIVCLPPRRKSTRATILPPPLTTIAGLRPMKVTAFREGGRLLLRAVNLPAPESMFLHEERSGGRFTLKLCNFVVEHDKIRCTQYEEDEEESVVREEQQVGTVEMVSTIDCKKMVEKETGDLILKKVSIDENLGLEDNNGEGEIGTTLEALRRPSRCIENDHKRNKLVLPFCKPYLVITST